MSDDPTPIEKAEEAVCEQIIARAGASSASEERAGELKKLAEGVAAMKHGPQGGAYNYAGTYSHTSDDHRTDHQGEDRPRPDAGFS